MATQTIEIQDEDKQVIEIVESSESIPVEYDSPNENKYVSENVANKVQDLDNPNKHTYPSSQAVYNEIQDKKDKHFRYHQTTPSATWDIKHNLEKYPSVTVIDSFGTMVEGAIEHVNENQTIIKFSAGFSGTADFN